MPEELLDQWNIIGKIGPVLFEKNSASLREENYIAQVKAQILDLKYETQPKYVLYPSEPLTPTKRYKREIDFIINSDFRNNIIGKLGNKFDKNALILIDYIEHGEILLEYVKNHCKDNPHPINLKSTFERLSEIKKAIPNKTKIPIIPTKLFMLNYSNFDIELHIYLILR